MEHIYDSIFETGTGDAEKALRILIDHGMADGELHKQWVIDQAIRALSGAYYQDLITAYNHGEDGPDTYMWDEGIPP